MLANEIAKRDVVIVVCTAAITASDGSDFEINQALSRGKLVVPMRYDDAPVPETLFSKIHDVFDDDNYYSKFDSVARVLPQLYERHLLIQNERQKARAKFQKLPVIQPSVVRPSERGAKLLESIVQAYYRDSLIEQVSLIENYDSSVHRELSFIQIGLRVPIPKDWMEETDRIVLVEELGTSVALGERNYLRNIWSKEIETEIFSTDEFNLEGFQQILHELSAGINPTVLFAPIDAFVRVASWIRNKIRPTVAIKWERGQAYFVLEDDRELKMFWSNKYAPLDHFVLIDPSATRWVVKPDPFSGKRLSATFVKNEKDLNKVDFLVKTVTSAELVNSNGVKLFKFE